VTQPLAAEPLLVALDVDGTIIDYDEAMSERVRSAVQDVARAGHQVVVATGRSLHATLSVLDRLGLVEGWVVCSNGGLTLRLDPTTAKGYEIVTAVTFDPSPALRVLHEFLPTARYAVEDVGVGFRITAPFPDGELAGELRIVDFDDLLAEPAVRVIVRSPEHTPEDFLRIVEEVGLHGVSYAVGWTAWLDLAPDGVSKASALEPVRAALGIDRSRTLAVGDGRNDVEMLQWAARSVAMGQAGPELLEVATEVTGRVEEDGLAQVLEPLAATALADTALANTALANTAADAR
jgi:hydroxymethylpyrimidine pyrophosphatase-like HAD family hydrolase